MHADPIVIVSVARTPIGGFLGALSGMTAPQLGGVAIRETVKRSGIDPQLIDELIMGCVLPAGLGQAPARQAALNAELPLSVGCTTINKVCGSGMKAMLLAHDLLRAENAQVMIAGGMESMSNAPYLLPKARQGYRLGHGQMIDHMFFDGLEDAYFDRGRLMGTFAEDCAENYGFTRQEQDAFAIRSTERAQRAIAEGLFAWETTPVTAAAGRQGDLVIVDDEQPPKVNVGKIPTLKPAVRKDGTVTEFDFRWRGGYDAHAPLSRRKIWNGAHRHHSRSQQLCGRAQTVSYSASRRNPISSGSTLLGDSIYRCV